MRTKTLVTPVVLMALLLTVWTFVIVPANAQSVIRLPQAAGPGVAAPNAPGRYIVEFNNDTVKTAPKLMREVGEDRKKFGLDVTNIFSHAIKGYAIENLTGADANKTLFDIKRTDKDVQSITPDAVVRANIQFTPTGIKRTDALSNTGTSYRIDNKEQKPDIDVAVIDTGVHKHQDLNVFKQVSFVDPAGTQHRDVCQGRSEGPHGTNVAGLIGARDNIGGIVGMAPGVRIWSLQVFQVIGNNCSAFTSTIVSALDYVVANAADIEIVNMSLGGFLTTSQSATEATSIGNAIAAGVVVVAAAGNDRTNVRWGPISGSQFRQAVPCVITGVICVGAISDFDGLCGGLVKTLPVNYALRTIDRDDRDAPYTNWDTSGFIDLYAPGSFIFTTYALPGIPFAYTWNSGTSFAAPIVAGAAAITLLNNPSFTPAQVESDLEAKAHGRGFTGGNVCSPPGSDSVGSVIIWNWYTDATKTPTSECVQNTAKPASITFESWCGAYNDPAKLLAVSGYP